MLQAVIFMGSFADFDMVAAHSACCLDFHLLSILTSLGLKTVLYSTILT